MICLLVCAALYPCLLLSGYAGAPSENHPRRHALNFKGKLVDVHASIYPVENISISGVLHAIKVYKRPACQTQDPAEHITYIDLAQVHTLEPAYTDPHDGLFFFKNRPYIELIITLNDTRHTQVRCMVEATRKLMCEVSTGVGPLEKELSFEAVKKLTITGRSEPEPTSSRAAQADCENADRQIAEMTRKLDNLQDLEQKSILRRTVDDLKQTLNRWCSE